MCWLDSGCLRRHIPGAAESSKQGCLNLADLFDVACEVLRTQHGMMYC